MSGAMVCPTGAHFLPIFTIFLLMLPVYNLANTYTFLLSLRLAILAKI